MTLQTGDSYSLSLRDLDLQADEGIVAFRIEVSGTGLQSLRWNHNNWSVSSTTVNGMAQSMGAAANPAAAVRPEDFRDFLVVAPQDGHADSLKLSGELTVQEMTGNATQRRLTLTPRQFDLRHLP